MVRISPHAQLVNTVLFAVAALFMKNMFIPGMQGILIILSILLFGVRYRGRILTFFLPLIPIIFFILILNAFRGGGEILLHAGPLILMKQGMVRGAYYSLFIVELFFMSRALTDSFSHEEFISTLYTIDSIVIRLIRKKNDAPDDRENGVVNVLFYTMRIFYNSYAQIKIFFKRRSVSLKEKTVLFFREAFFRSLNEFERRPVGGFYIVRMTPGDILYILLQIIFIVPAFLLPVLHV